MKDPEPIEVVLNISNVVDIEIIEDQANNIDFTVKMDDKQVRLNIKRLKKALPMFVDIPMLRKVK